MVEGKIKSTVIPKCGCIMVDVSLLKSASASVLLQKTQLTVWVYVFTWFVE